MNTKRSTHIIDMSSNNRPYAKKNSYSAISSSLPIRLFKRHSQQMKLSFASLLVFFFLVGFSGNISAQKMAPQRSSFITEKKQMAEKISAEEKLELTKQEIEFIDTNVKDLKVEIEQVKKDAKKAKLFKEEEKYQALETKLEELRQMARDFKMIKTKSLTAI
jgi:hypothetical protein